LGVGDGGGLVVDVVDGLEDCSGERVPVATTAASLAESVVRDPGFCVVDSVIVVKGVTVNVRVDAILDVSDAVADGDVDGSLSIDEESLCVVEIAKVVEEGTVMNGEAGIAGKMDRSLDAHTTRTPWITSMAS
jgi:hypothetical protein